VAIARAAHDRLSEFRPQELSMIGWAFAKLVGRGRAMAEGGSRARRNAGGGFAVKNPRTSAELRDFLQDLAAEAERRLPDFSPQSVSNLAWAFATLELLFARDGSGRAPAGDFLVAAMAVAAQQLSSYSPQAVSNLMWAVVRLEVKRGKARLTFDPFLPHERTQIAAFAAAATRETTVRMLEFDWRDLAGVIVSLAHGHLRIPEALTFATMLVGHAASRCRELTTQMMLNIAQSAVRLGVPREAMQAMVDGIAACVADAAADPMGGPGQRPQLNEVDLRQWREVQAWCAPRRIRWGQPMFGLEAAY